MVNQKFATYLLPSFPRKRESIGVENKWIPARARLRGLDRNDGNLCNELATHHASNVAVSTRALGRLQNFSKLDDEMAQGRPGSLW
jgi:hypothetical protein